MAWHAQPFTDQLEITKNKEKQKPGVDQRNTISPCCGKPAIKTSAYEQLWTLDPNLSEWTFILNLAPSSAMNHGKKIFETFAQKNANPFYLFTAT